MPSKVLLDCDPGVDDAIAILTAAHFCDLVGVTTVNGNVGIDHTTHNALLVAQIANLDVDVHSGASRPLVAAPSNTARIHGPTGLGDVPLPKLNRQAKSDDAVAYICDTARSVDGLHLLAVGPLTNIALALRSDPDLRSSLDGITIMGGSARSGNVTPTAEFNIWADPEAAAIVFNEAAPITMVGLNTTTQVLLGMEEVNQIRSAATPASIFAADLIEYSYNRCVKSKLPATPVHDATAVIAVTHPHLFKRARHHVTVKTRGKYMRGMTVIDTRFTSISDASAAHAYEESSKSVPSHEVASSHTPSLASFPHTRLSHLPHAYLSHDVVWNNVVWEVQAEAVKELIVEAVTLSPIKS